MRAQWKAPKDCYWAWNNITEVHTLNYTALVLVNKLASDTYTHDCRDFWVTQIYLLTLWVCRVIASILASRPPLPPQGSDKGCCQIVEKFISCLFINTFPWPRWKTSGGQGKMWRRIKKKQQPRCLECPTALTLSYVIMWQQRLLMWFCHGETTMFYLTQAPPSTRL